MRAVFLDRDGTLCVGTPTIERVDSLDKVQLLPTTLEALELLKTLDYAVFIITNQAGISEGLISVPEFWEINDKLLRLLAPSGIAIVDTYLCPHQESDRCDCRKPKPKLLLDAAQEHDIDLAQSWMIGDRATDVETGINAGVKTILVKTGNPDAHSDAATHTASTLLEAVQYLQSSN